MRYWLAVTFLLVFSAGAACGVLVLQFQGETEESTPARESRGYDLTPEIPMYLVTNEEVYEELGLSRTQRDEVSHLLASYEQRVGQARSTLADASRRLRRDVDSILGQQQRQALAAIQERYAEREIQQAAERRLAQLRSEIALDLHQEALVFRILFDSVRERRQLWRSKPRPERAILLERTGVICSRRDERLKDILNAEQFAAYAAMKEREKELRKRCKARSRRKEKPAAPAAEPASESAETPTPIGKSVQGQRVSP